MRGPALVTGASGFIGRHLVRRLLDDGREVVAFARHPESLLALHEPTLRLAAGDLRDASSYHGLLGPEISVFHLAGVRNRIGTRPEALEQVNIDACLELAEHALEARVARFIHVSTALVFGPSSERPLGEGDGICEECLERPYLRSRVEASRRLRKLAGRDLPLVIVSPTIVFGPDHRSHRNRVTERMRWLLRCPVDLVLGSGLARRNLVLVDDVVDGILAAEGSAETGDEFIVGGDEISQREFGRLVRRLAGRSEPLALSISVAAAEWWTRAIDRLAGLHPGTGFANAVWFLTREWRFSSDKARRLLGYRHTPLTAALQRTIQFLDQERRPSADT